MSEQPQSFFDSYFATFLAERSDFDHDKKERFTAILHKLTGCYQAGHSCLPVTEDEQKLLQESHLVSWQDQNPTDSPAQAPLVLYKDMLYLQRYFHYERRLARQLHRMAAITFEKNDDEETLDIIFDKSSEEPDYQKEAAKLALKKTLTIISGGPGTGKTTTVVKILALLLAREGTDLRIGLAAPTGKAAMRLQQSITSSIDRMQLPQAIKEAIPTEARTLHRLLGVQRHSPQFKHNSRNPVAWDVVVVDEASMVDLAMMSKLVDALGRGSRLLLLGDKDQLASVESGAVLADLIKSLPNNSVELKKTYRFNRHIKSLAENIKGGDAETAWNMLESGKAGHEGKREKDKNINLLQRELISYIADKYLPYMEAVNASPSQDPRQIMAIFNCFQVLSGVHYGERGVEGLNRRVEVSLYRRGFNCRTDQWYPGRPVLVTSNDYSLELFNGDIGICLPAEDGKSLQVWFERPDGKLRRYSPYRLPSCRTVFAMTIHKSQGSEFDEVVVVFPEEDQRVLSRELIYTAITRAKKSVIIAAEKEVFKEALSRKITRFSGLSQQLSEEFI